MNIIISYYLPRKITYKLKSYYFKLYFNKLVEV